MDLYIVRHGIAEDVSDDGTDESRALTPKGRKKMKRVVRGLAELDIAFDRIFFSPWLRAQETAEILMDLCDEDDGCETEVASELARAPGAELLTRISTSDAAHIAVVGHEPWLSGLAAWLTCGWKVFDGGAANCLFDLQKGGVIHLQGDPIPGSMVLVAAYPPSTLIRLGRR
jgi:phosphohistidine phosphatase